MIKGLKYCRYGIQSINHQSLERNIKKIEKVKAILIEFLNARTSRAPTCMHGHEKLDRFNTSKQHTYPF